MVPASFGAVDSVAAVVTGAVFNIGDEGLDATGGFVALLGNYVDEAL